MKKQLFPINIDNFAEIIRHRDSHGNAYLYIDKTSLIQAVLDAQEKIIWIHRPQGFGKTLNLSMLEHFFASELLGVPTHDLFHQLAISNNKEVLKHQGQYPTIFVTFKNLQIGPFDLLFQEFKLLIRDLFENNDHLLFSQSMSDSQKQQFDTLTVGKATQAEYIHALKFLTKLLYQHTERKVLVLLDTYDTPYHHKKTNNAHDAWVGFFNQLFTHTFQGNDFLYKAILAGNTKQAMPQPTNKEPYATLVSDKNPSSYTPFFGLNSLELHSLCLHLDIPQHEQKLKQASHYKEDQSTMYNTASVIRFLADTLPIN